MAVTVSYPVKVGQRKLLTKLNLMLGELSHVDIGHGEIWTT